jgi:hypothetical protein
MKTPWRLAILAVALLLLAAASAWIVMTFFPPGERMVPSIIALVVIATAIVLIDYLVLKPAIILYARRRSREVSGRPREKEKRRER